MPILRSLLFKVARRAASDERVQRAASDIYHNKVKPRAEAAWQEAKPRIKATKSDVGKIASETDALRHPGSFAGKAAKRILSELKTQNKK